MKGLPPQRLRRSPQGAPLADRQSRLRGGRPMLTAEWSHVTVNHGLDVGYCLG